MRKYEVRVTVTREEIVTFEVTAESERDARKMVHDGSGEVIDEIDGGTIDFVIDQVDLVEEDDNE